MDEQQLIRLFTDLTGESERSAQSVIMYLDFLTDGRKPESEPAKDEEDGRAPTPDEPKTSG